MGAGEDSETVGLKDAQDVKASTGGVSLAAPATASAAGLSFQGSSVPGPPGVGPPIDLESQCTLDEPVKETIMRDLRSIADKLKFVLMPTGADKRAKLRDWDLWGPLLLCLALGLIIAAQAPDADQASYAFADVFVTVWVGSAVVTLNALLLRGRVSFFQTVCVLGYCLSPLVAAAFVSMLLKVEWLKLIFVIVGVVWAARASVGFMAELVPEDKRLLGLYPVWLFYAAIAWMIILT